MDYHRWLDENGWILFFIILLLVWSVIFYIDTDTASSFHKNQGFWLGF